MLVAKNIHKNYGELEILKGIDITINKKEIACIVGASGAGKTTLLQILGTLDQPDLGSIELNGESILGFEKKKLAKNIRREFEIRPKTKGKRGGAPARLPLLDAQRPVDEFGAVVALNRLPGGGGLIGEK